LTLTALIPVIRAAPGDGVVFTTEELALRSSHVTRCAQIGIYLTYQGPFSRRWSIVNTTLNYQASAGLLAGTPVVRLSGFGAGEPGLTSPGTPLVNHAGESTRCSPSEIENRLTAEGGEEVPFVPGSGTALHSEFLNPETGRIQLHASSKGNLFQTEPGEEVLLAVVSFPISADSSGTIRVEFVPEDVVLDGNKLVDLFLKDLSASTHNGAIHVRPSGPGLVGWAFIFFVAGLGLAMLPRLGFYKRSPED
jgi:hypothetical protein